MYSHKYALVLDMDEFFMINMTKTGMDTIQGFMDKYMLPHRDLAAIHPGKMTHLGWFTLAA